MKKKKKIRKTILYNFIFYTLRKLYETEFKAEFMPSLSFHGN